MEGTPDVFESHRQTLQRLAYRMLGSVSDAEDAVQDAFLRWHGRRDREIDNPRAYLSTLVTRLCLDRLKEARRAREVYVGEWLPEPLIEAWGGSEDPRETLVDDVSVALLLALERLSPLERAAFLLRDVFDMEFAEIATTLNRSEAACRQLAARARRHVQDGRPRFALDPQEGEAVAGAFFEALRTGETAGLSALLAEGAVLHSDGGGRRPATLRPIEGADKIRRFFEGLSRKGVLMAGPWSIRLRVNAMPGLAALGADGTLQTIALEIREARIQAIYITRNPDKLAHVARLVPGELRQA